MIRSLTRFTFYLLFLILGTSFSYTAEAQLQRERVDTDQPVEDIFWAPVNIGISTVDNVPSKNLNTSVIHTFGLINGGIDRFFGMDDGANTRIGLEYGITDRFSVGMGRMTFNKVVDINSKINLLRQTETGSTPVDLAVKISTGINTTSGIGLEFSDRLSYFTSLKIARKMEALSLQITPMAAYFNSPSGANLNRLLGLGLLFNYELNDRFAISGEYLPILGDRNPGTHNAAAIALNIYTGGHIFQIFLASSQWHNEQYIMAFNRDRFWEGDFRFGFNIHRIFGLGS
ncbi:hypothetical protein DYD21_13700 [Rhodohalobacter sp. SW132]|uniref:DUF5777 family beta-barrel protein n=1 Tax=Rhodohalobacter sp. SW132 TaxID=2293433 RepID=UPI000E26FB52|nr:DUF5777 family beta-barrel protein [Rhodohalobacter sp. SW132]REL32872.1 hypothetical protein DYD21_13700 [Rhodohalobacter sp. SW132]